MQNNSCSQNIFYLHRLGICFGQIIQSKLILSIATSVSPGVVYFANTNKKVVALTIDDSPDFLTTPGILDTLSRYQAKATFFVITNKVAENEFILRDIMQRGHEIGNHLTSDKPSIILSESEFEADLLKAHSILSSYSELRWLRPASGWYTRSMVNTACKYNYQVVLGSVFPFDTFIYSAKFSSEYIMSNIFPGAIIVLHDTGTWGENSAKALEDVLPKLSKKGYSVVTLSELLTLS